MSTMPWHASQTSADDFWQKFGIYRPPANAADPFRTPKLEAETVSCRRSLVSRAVLVNVGVLPPRGGFHCATRVAREDVPRGARQTGSLACMRRFPERAPPERGCAEDAIWRRPSKWASGLHAAVSGSRSAREGLRRGRDLAGLSRAGLVKVGVWPARGGFRIALHPRGVAQRTRFGGVVPRGARQIGRLACTRRVSMRVPPGRGRKINVPMWTLIWPLPIKGQLGWSTRWN